MKPKNLRRIELVLFDLDEFCPISEQILEVFNGLGKGKMIMGFVVRDVQEL